MDLPISILKNRTLRQAMLCLVLTSGYLCACSTNPQKEMTKYTLELPKILDQVNEAIQVAKSLNKSEDAPEISSIQLDLEIETSTQVSGSFPISLVAVDGEMERDKADTISIVFTPKTLPSISEPEKEKVSELAQAISAIDTAVAEANPSYLFEKGSVKLRCSLKVDGEAKVKLVPLKASAYHSHELVQTITLNFYPNSVSTKKIDAPPSKD